MSTINAINPNIDQTVRIFDQFYNYAEDVPAAEYDIVLSYFKSVFNTEEQAQNFTVAMFRVAQESQTDVLTILDQIQGSTGPQLTASLCYYFNSVRSNATLLGVLEPAAPNYWTARNVRQ
jgi:pyruvate/2-oxoacid:ferredoxin oxidoreductase alpha subunit